MGKEDKEYYAVKIYNAIKKLNFKQCKRIYYIIIGMKGIKE